MILTLLLVACGGEPAGDAAPQGPEPEPSGPTFARGPGVLVTIAEVEDRVRQTGESPSHAAAALLEDAVLAAAATKAGLDRDAEARRMRRQVLVQRLLEIEVERTVRPETIPETEVAAAYAKNRAAFEHPEQVKVEHFLARLDKTAPPAKVAEQRALAESVLEAARAAPDQPLETFRESLPAGVSVDFETLPPFSAHSIYDPAFEAAALALRGPSDLSPVVRSGFGFHVIRLLERVGALHRPLAEVEGELRTKLLPEMRKRRLQALIAQIGEREGVTVDPRPLALLR